MICTTQLLQKYSKLLIHHIEICLITSLLSVSLSLSLLPILVATIASVEFSWFETKTYPIATHLDGPDAKRFHHHHRKLGAYLDRIGWGEPKAKRKHCTRTPFLFCFREGKVTYPLFSKPRAHTHTLTQKPSQAITSISMTSHWRDAIALQVGLVFAHGLC